MVQVFRLPSLLSSGEFFLRFGCYHHNKRQVSDTSTNGWNVIMRRWHCSMSSPFLYDKESRYVTLLSHCGLNNQFSGLLFSCQVQVHLLLLSWTFHNSILRAFNKRFIKITESRGVLFEEWWPDRAESSGQDDGIRIKTNRVYEEVPHITWYILCMTKCIIALLAWLILIDAIMWHLKYWFPFSSFTQPKIFGRFNRCIVKNCGA